MRKHSKQYLDRVVASAKGNPEDPLYAGDHLQDLADYLQRPLKNFKSAGPYIPPSNSPFVYLYDLLSPTFPNVQRFDTVEDYEQVMKNGKVPYKNGLMFLTGQPTPEWLSAVGGSLDIDPMFLAEHLHLRLSAARTHAFPAFLARDRVIMRLSVPVIGYVQPAKAKLPSIEMQALRRECAKVLKSQTYSGRETGRGAGSSITRRFALLETSTFVIEQDITMTIVEQDRGWTVLAWCDAGGDSKRPGLVIDQIQGYEDSELLLMPIIQDSRRSRPWQAVTTPLKHGAAEEKSASPLLAAHYGKLLNEAVAAQDAFYVLKEVFELAAAAQRQFLNLMAMFLDAEIELASGPRDEAPTLADFRYYSSLLEHHMLRLKENVVLLDEDSGLSWPSHPDTSQQEIARASRRELLGQFRVLFERASASVDRAERGSDLVLNNTNLLLAQESFNLNRELGRLTAIGTWVAMLYVPLSYVTSVFGMNFKQFGQGTLSIYWWPPMSFVALLLPLLVLIFLRPDIRRAVYRYFSNSA